MATKCWMASLNFALITKKWGVACQSESIQMDSSCYKQCKSSKFKSNANWYGWALSSHVYPEPLPIAAREKGLVWFN